MKLTVQISRNTSTQSQFASQCRSALRKAGGVYTDWAEYITGAFEEMNSIKAGKQSRYYNSHKADEERNFDEVSSCSESSYQLFLHDYTDNSRYNFIVEYEDGAGYMYCEDSTAKEN